jgi:hypothetical protein
MKNENQPIYPDPMRGAEQSFSNQSPHELPMGLTKREYFAGLAMQGIIAGNLDVDDVAHSAVKMADAVLAELEKTKDL